MTLNKSLTRQKFSTEATEKRKTTVGQTTKHRAMRQTFLTLFCVLVFQATLSTASTAPAGGGAAAAAKQKIINKLRENLKAGPTPPLEGHLYINDQTWFYMAGVLPGNLTSTRKFRLKLWSPKQRIRQQMGK